MLKNAFFLFLILSCWILFTPSAFRKGGIEIEYLLLSTGIGFGITAFIAYKLNTFAIFEKIILTLFSIPFSFFLSCYFTSEFIDFLYDGIVTGIYPRIFVNSIHYGLYTIAVLASFLIYGIFRNWRTNKNKTSI